MRLIDISYEALHTVAFLFYLNCLAAVFCAMRSFGSATERKTGFLRLIAALPSYFASSALAIYFNYVLLQRKTLPPVIYLLLKTPVWVVGLIAAASCAATIYMFIRIKREIRQTLTTQSVCEGLDQLPNGISYSKADGFPQLTNNKMQQISNTAFGMGVLNTSVLRRRLQERELQPGCSVDERDGNLFLRLPDGGVWLLQEQQVTVNNRELTETIAFDVTQRYNDLIELEQRNARLEAVNLQMREYLNNINRVVREKEILAAKIRLHANLGQSLLAIREYLTQGEGDKQSVIEQIADTVALLQSNEPDEHSEDKFYALFDAARSVGVEINLKGEIPPAYSELLATAIHECLTNTVKHAAGHTLDAEIIKNEESVTVTLTNDGKPPAGPVEETGGLKNLRSLTERTGGEMHIESAPAFRLTLTLPRQDKTPVPNRPEGGENA